MAAVVGCVVVVVCSVVGTEGRVAEVATVAVFGVGSVSSSNLTRRRLSRVLPTAALSRTSASVRVSCNTCEIFTEGRGGGTVGHVMGVVGVVALVVGCVVIDVAAGVVAVGGAVVLVGSVGSVGKECEGVSRTKRPKATTEHLKITLYIF